jgi:hypothetical protein
MSLDNIHFSFLTELQDGDCIYQVKTMMVYLLHLQQQLSRLHNVFGIGVVFFAMTGSLSSVGYVWSIYATCILASKKND